VGVAVKRDRLPMQHYQRRVARRASRQESVSNGFPPGVRHRNGTFQETSEFGVSFIYTGIGSSSRILNDNGFQLFDANEYEWFWTVSCVVRSIEKL
jgi:hypothetical protein